MLLRYKTIAQEFGVLNVSINANVARHTALASILYATENLVAIPKLMIGNMQVAVTTMDFQDWYELLLKFVIFGLLTVSVNMILMPQLR